MPINHGRSQDPGGPRNPRTRGPDLLSCQDIHVPLESSQVQVVHIEEMVFRNGVLLYWKNLVFLPNISICNCKNHHQWRECYYLYLRAISHYVSLSVGCLVCLSVKS